MNAFISGSPNSEPHAPTNPPPNPFVPATPTVVPLTGTTTESPSSTLHADPLEDGRDLVGLVGVVVVIAEHGHHRYVDVNQLVGQGFGLLPSAHPGQVTGQQQEVGSLPEMLEVGAQRPGGVRCEVDVSGSGDVNHRSVAPSSSATSDGSGKFSSVVVALSIS